MATTETAIKQSSRPSAAPRTQIDWFPLLLVPVLSLASLPFIGSANTWLSLTIAGIAMGMIIFIIASGLTLIFGLMDVLNFGHGLFISLGAFVAGTVLGLLGDWMNADNLLLNVSALLTAMAAAMVVTGVIGWIFERVLIRRVYGLNLMQILITMGGMVIGQELLKVVWGPEQRPLLLPVSLRDSFIVADAAIEKYRLFAVVVGLAVFGFMMLVLNRTKVGLLIRAGVQDREMVESLGYRIKSLFIGVFVTGTGLAGLGGVMWGLYQQNIVPEMGSAMNVLIFIVIIIGGLGSTGGSFLAAMLVGLLANYAGYLVPKIGLVSNILLMVAILAWRPNGLYKITSR